MGKERISKSTAIFNTYINNGNTYLMAGTPTNGTRLGLSSAQQTEWTARCTNWKDNLYPKFSSSSLRTPAVIEAVHNFIRDFKLFANPLLDMMAANPAANEDDEHTFNFIKRENRKKPERKTEAITQQCYGTIESLGGGIIRNSCRTNTDTKRPSLAEGADGVEVAYIIDKKKDTPPPPPGQPAEEESDLPPAPTHPDMIHQVFSKAKFLLECGPENKGRMLIIYHRWINTKYPKLAGPWSANYQATFIT